jgi:hypothetical protein
MHNRINPTAPFHPRNGTDKRTPTPAIVAGHRSRIAPAHPWKPGAPLDDLKEPALSREQPIAIHSGMTAKQVAKHKATAGNASDIFNEAAKLGR